MSKPAFTPDVPPIDDDTDELPPMAVASRVSFDDLAAMAVPASVMLGESTELTKVKDDLVGTEFIITAYTFRQGDNSPEYVSVECRTRDGRKLVFNDGSTGVYAELRAMDPHMAPDDTRDVNIYVKHGLRKSEYRVCDEHRKPCRRKVVDGAERQYCREGDHYPAKTGTGATYYIDRS